MAQIEDQTWQDTPGIWVSRGTIELLGRGAEQTAATPVTKAADAAVGEAVAESCLEGLRRSQHGHGDITS